MPRQADRARPTLGVLAGWQVYERTTPNWFLEAVVTGVIDACRALDCNALVSCGIHARIDDPRLVRPSWPEPGTDCDFVPVGPWNTDGLIFVSPLRTPARRGYATALQRQGFPILFVGSGDGQPAVVADSATGFREALEHLRGHGHRTIAFVWGDPLDEGDSQRRRRDFLLLRGELGLAQSDELLAPGLHSEQGGYDAMRSILARGLPFTAVLASNDMSAIGAIRALREAGRSVPGDVAVVGFDDQPCAAAHVPPLATVRYPLREAGRRAAQMLIAQIERGERPPDTTALRTELVERRSCGCLHQQVELRDGPASDSDVALAMAMVIKNSGSPLDTPALTALCRRLADGLEQSRVDGARTAFEAALRDVLQCLEAADDRAHRWQSALTRLRAGLCGAHDARSRLSAETLLDQARIALSESADRQEARRALHDAAQADRVNALTVPLQSAQDEARIVALLKDHAPQLGVRPFCLAFYEAEGDDPVRWSRVRVLEGSPEPRAAGECERVETRELLCSALRGGEHAHQLAVLPLGRDGAPAGFLAVETATLAPGAAIARQLTVAVESVRLQAAVRALSLTDDLTGLHNRRFFEVELRREAERARRFKRSVALVLIDLDHFKAYNDAYGHRAGDDALRTLARHLVEAAPRRLDAVARYGGEEFAILLAETDVEGARRVAERAREAVEASGGFLRPLTLSAGVAAAHGDASEGEDLVLRADEALYRAKHDGRNRVRVAP